MANCPFCGDKMVNGRCIGCGYTEYRNNDEIYGEAVEKESKVIYDEPHTNMHRNYVKELGGLWKVIFVLISIFGSPIFGLIISIVLITRPYHSYKSFGWKLLILNIVLLILRIVFGLMVGIFSILMLGADRVIHHGGTIMDIMMFL